MTDIARGLQGVVLTKTHLSQVEGQAGRLTIAGYPVQELAPHACHEEVVHLLWHDRLPNAEELSALRERMSAERGLPQATLDVLAAAAQQNLPPMDGLRLGLDTLSLVDEDPSDSSRPANLRRAVSLVARAPTIVSAMWRLLHGLEPVPPRQDLGHAENFLYMLFGQAPHPAAVRGLETYLNTVVDHGMNASTFAARVIVSTRSDMISAVVGAVGALKGPLHGGAPGPALDTVFALRKRAEVSGRPIAEVARDWARETVERGDRIMGFGHRVYKVRDPRADVLGAAAEKLFEGTGDSQLYDDARACEAVFIEVLDELKPGRKLQTNVEFYTALVLHGVGLEPPIFSSVFAVGRMGGWSANVLEQIEDDVLIRPRAEYVGATGRTWIPVDQR
jgi:citrate synthase